jgi:hypothetical protein
LPSNLSAAAISIAGNGAGQASVKVTALVTPEKMDEAVRKKPRSSPTRSLKERR